MIDRPNLLIVR